MGASIATVGMAYRDLVLTGLPRLPELGEELHGTALHETWGGIGNQARVCAALGVDTWLVAPAGDDEASARMLAAMQDQGVNVSACPQHVGWSLPVTIALSLPNDRAMATVETAPPTPIAPVVPLQVDALIVDLRDAAQPWIRDAREMGKLVYASRGYDASGKWDRAGLSSGCDVMMLNELEARMYTGESDPLLAARSLTAQVPVVVVTLGADGLLAVDSRIGEEASVPAYPAEIVSTTGAGDTTLAAFAFASHLPGTTLRERLQVAAFVAAQVLSREGGATHPPPLTELKACAPTEIAAILARA